VINVNTNIINIENEITLISLFLSFNPIASDAYLIEAGKNPKSLNEINNSKYKIDEYKP